MLLMLRAAQETPQIFAGCQECHAFCCVVLAEMSRQIRRILQPWGLPASTALAARALSNMLCGVTVLAAKQCS